MLAGIRNESVTPRSTLRALALVATRLELKFTDPGSTSILNLYGARARYARRVLGVGCFRFRGFAPVGGGGQLWGCPPI